MPSVSGLVHGGQQPVAGATVQLYVANATVNKGASSALLPSPVITNANGNFTFPGDYPCPSPDALVYLVATGGNPGLSGSVNNTALTLMTVVGTCGTLNAATFVAVNELTTVASVEALAPFMADATHVGSDAGDPGGLAGAFGTATSLVNSGTGRLQTPAAGVTLPVALLNTLADILAACVNTDGTVSVAPGKATACGTLLANAGDGTPTDTVKAMLGIVQTPGANVGALFGLANAQAPFQPVLGTAPSDWTLPIFISLPFQNFGSEYRLLVIDTSQHIWVYSQTQASGDNPQYVPGPITVYDNSGSLLFTVPPGTGGLNLAVELAADPFGNVWALNANATLSKFGPDGSALSPGSGFKVPFNVSGSILNGANYVYALGPAYMSIDPGGNVWGIGAGSTSDCYIKISNSGDVITPPGNFCSRSANPITVATTTDGSGNAWFVGTGSVSKTSGQGAFLLSGTNNNGCFSVDPSSATTIGNATQNLLWDRAQNQLWGVGDTSVGALRGDGSQVFCDAYGANLPVIPFSTFPTGGGDGFDGYDFVSSAALDGGGNLWFTTSGVAFVIRNGSLIFESFSGLNSLNSAGKLTTPYNAAKGVYGLSSALPGIVGENGMLSQELAVDAYGNLWTIEANQYLVKIPGLAVPKNYQ